MNWTAFWKWLDDLLEAIVYGDKKDATITLDYTTNLVMSQPDPKTPPVAQNPAPTATPAPVATPTPSYLWNSPINVRHSVRVICDEEGLTVDQKNALCATLECESAGFQTQIVHPNYVIKNGVKSVSTTDYGLCQINDYWHIGPGKDFPSVDYVLNNPEACVRWMCKLAKAGKLNLWVCYSTGLYKKYL